jgi:Uma2 family endonuclease
VARDNLASERVRPLRRAEYDRLVGLGAFEGEKLELLYGRLVSMSPQGQGHAFSIRRLTRLLVLGLRERADVCVQLPFVASDLSEPEPDVAIVPVGDYLEGHPRSALLVIEVAESSVGDDRSLKGPLYAAAGVPEYWIVNLVEGVVEVYREPRDGVYALVSRHDRDATLAVPGFADVRIAVRDVVPQGAMLGR